jgi:hypothetical protein
MPNKARSVKVVAHFSGLPDVSGLSGKPIQRRPASPDSEPELEFPPAMIVALRERQAGEPVVVRYDRKGKGPLVLASRGKKVNLAGKQSLIEEAMDAGKPVEVHVFDEPHEKG